MAGQNLKQLLEKARKAMRKNTPSDNFLQLRESLRDDYYWEAMSMELAGKDMDNIEEVKTIGYGQTPEEALIELIGKLDPSYNLNDNLWKEIMDMSQPAPPEVSSDCNVIRLVKLRKILEKYKILGDEKDGM